MLAQKTSTDDSAIRAAHAGHIPTAINIDWKDNLDCGSGSGDSGGEIFKSHGKLEQMYSNIPKNAEVIVYCQGGYGAQIVSSLSRCLDTRMCECILALGVSGATDWTCQ